MKTKENKCLTEWNKENCGFTLVEMLVVIGILGLLMAILLPVLSKARDRADQAQCLNNSRQLVLAWTLYSQDYADKLVPNVDGMLGGFTNWVAGHMGNKLDAKDAQLLIDPNRSLLSSYLKVSQVFKCPADESQFPRSVSMNCRMNPTRPLDGGLARWVRGLGERYVSFRKLTDIKYPDRIFVILDESEKSINDAYFVVDMSNTGNFDGEGASRPYYWIDYPAGYHSRGATVSFADGHVAIQKWKESSTLKDVRPVSYVPQPNRDVAWLQEHCTYAK